MAAPTVTPKLIDWDASALVATVLLYGEASEDPYKVSIDPKKALTTDNLNNEVIRQAQILADLKAEEEDVSSSSSTFASFVGTVLTQKP